MKLQNDLLLQSTNASVTNHSGVYLGEVAEVTFDSLKENLEYLILKSSEFFGPRTRYFAIPVRPELVSISEEGTIILNAKKDDFQFAKGLKDDEAPPPNLEFSPDIYELYQYYGTDPKKVNRVNNI